MLSAFLSSSLGRSNVEILLGTVLNYDNLFLFMMTRPSVTQLFSVRQEVSGSLLLLSRMVGRESSCPLFSTPPLDQFLSQIKALTAVALQQGTGARTYKKHRAVPVFSRKNRSQNIGNNYYKFLKAGVATVNFRHLKSNLQRNRTKIV